MEYKSVKGFNGLSMLGFMFVFVGLGFVLAMIVQWYMLSMALPAGSSFTNGVAVAKVLKDPKNVQLVRWMQVISAFVLMFIPSILWSRVVNGKSPLWLGFSNYINWKQVVIACVLIFLSGILAGPLTDFSKAIVENFPGFDRLARNLEKEYNDQVMMMTSLKTWPDFIVGLIIMAFLPALFEELMFRGVIQNLLVKWWGRPLLAIVVTSFLFSFIHLSIYLFLGRALLGFVMGWMYFKCRNIWVNIIAHFVNNATVLAIMFYQSMVYGKANPETADPQIPWVFSIIALPALIFLFHVFERVSAKNKSAVEMKEQVLRAEAYPFIS